MADSRETTSRVASSSSTATTSSYVSPAGASYTRVLLPVAISTRSMNGRGPVSRGCFEYSVPSRNTLPPSEDSCARMGWWALPRGA